MKNVIQKIIPYLLIVVVMIGVFGVEKTYAEDLPTDVGTCNVSTINEIPDIRQNVTRAACAGMGSNPRLNTFNKNTTSGTPGSPSSATGITEHEADVAAGTSPLGKAISDYGCISLTNGFDGCLVKLVYYLFYSIPSFFLNLIANLFNLVIPLALNSAMYSGSFIANTWVIVRDLSNMFFILVLLYIAIELILGLAHDAKKMITRVVVMALLINFSMFFTTVVIDSSNILALIFYNKMDINSTVIDVNGKETTRFYTPMLKNGTIDKDVSGGLVYKFDPTKFLTPEFFDKATKEAVAVPTSVGSVVRGAGTSIAIGAAVGNVTGAILGGIVYGLSFLGSPRVPPAIMIGILITSGLIMMFAIWAFFVASISFIGRIIELWVLIIFSPFAFMSSTIPILERVSYIGWEEWSKRLLKTSFMAPIFMFFMYVIFKISNTNIWNDFAATGNRQLIPSMLFLLLPGLIILVLLQQATKFAKEGGGKFADVFVGLSKLAGGLAIGAGVGLTASAVAKTAQGTLGRLGKSMAESTKYAEWETNTDKGVAAWWRRKRGAYYRDSGKRAATSGYDLRAGVLGGALGGFSKVTGMNVSNNSNLFRAEAGGYEADLKKRDAKRKERVAGLQLKKSEKPIQDLQKAKDIKQTMLVAAAHTLHEIDAQTDAARKKAADLASAANSLKNTDDARLVKQKKDALIAASLINDPVAQTAAIARANAMDTSDPVKVAAKEKADEAAQKANAVVLELRDRRGKIKAADASQLAALTAEATNIESAVRSLKAAIAAGTATSEQKDSLADLENKAHAIKTAAEVAKISSENGGQSISMLEDKIIPHLEHKIAHINDKRTRNFADNLENSWVWPWNTGERAQSAYEIRQGIKAEVSAEKSGGGGRNFLTEVLAGIVAEKIAEPSHGGGHGGGDSHGGGDEGHGGGHGGGDSHGGGHGH